MTANRWEIINAHLSCSNEGIVYLENHLNENIKKHYVSMNIDVCASFLLSACRSLEEELLWMKSCRLLKAGVFLGRFVLLLLFSVWQSAAYSWETSSHWLEVFRTLWWIRGLIPLLLVSRWNNDNENIVMELVGELPSGMGSYQVTADNYFGIIDSANTFDKSGFGFNMVITNPRVCQDFEVQSHRDLEREV